MAPSAQTSTSNTDPDHFDVIIVGAGFAGVVQARHLLLKKPDIRVALIDKYDEDEREKLLKVGESMIEVATMFVNYELGLYEYMIDNHPPKFGLSYHWPKDSSKTDKLADYFHVWANRNPQVQSYHVKRSLFEADLLRMNRAMGAEFLKGTVTEIDITEGNADNHVTVRLSGDNSTRHLSAPWVVDSAGRSHLLARKFDNLIWDNEIVTGAFWVRVEGVDRDMFVSQVDRQRITSSPFYCTNHWFGPGHWMWQIPIDKEDRTLSIGVVHHKNVIESHQINTLDKFLSFVKNNHNVVYQLIMSGKIIDHNYWSKLAFESKRLMHPNGWMVLGDSGVFFDPFYSIGMTMVALQVECFTDAVLSRDRQLTNSKIETYNNFNFEYQKVFRKVVQHFGHCSSASVMSTRIFFDFIGYFGFTLPMYIGKYHLTKTYCEFVTQWAPHWVEFMEHCYTQLDIIAQKGINIGMMDYSHSDQLPWSHYSPSDMVGDFIENAKLEPLRLDISYNNQQTCFHLMQWYAHVMYRAYGVSGLVWPSTLSLFAKLSGAMVASHGLSWWHWWTYRNKPANEKEANMWGEAQEHTGQTLVALQDW